MDLLKIYTKRENNPHVDILGKCKPDLAYNKFLSKIMSKDEFEKLLKKDKFSVMIDGKKTFFQKTNDSLMYRKPNKPSKEKYQLFRIENGKETRINDIFCNNKDLMKYMTKSQLYKLKRTKNKTLNDGYNTFRLAIL